jgi:hypothetical protein
MMKSLPEYVFCLQYAQEMLEPAMASLHQQDTSELFLSVAPSLAQRSYSLVQSALRLIVRQGWYAGRRGHVSKLLIDAAGSLQQAIHAADWDTAARQTTLAAERVREALSTCYSIVARPRRRI